MNFPIKVGNETDVENYAKTLIKGEEQLLITRNGKQFLTDGKGNYITINTGTGGGTGNANIDDTKNSATTTYSSEKIETITGNINDDTLDNVLKGKSLQDQIKQVFTYANSNLDGKKLIGNAIGRNYTSLSYEGISNDIILQKKNICNALKNKGVIANDYDELNSYADKINSIVQNSQIKNTKLNIKKGDTKQIILTNPTDIQNVCTSVLEYKAGEGNIVKYDCGFNNGDSTSFEYVSNIIFDGKMKQGNKVIDDTFIKTQETEKFTEYQYHINKKLFHTLDNIESYEENEIEKIKLTGTYFPVVVKANDDINLNGIDKINKIIWIASDGNISKNRLIFSLDSGITWKSYDVINKILIDIDINNLSEVKNKGLTIEQVNNLTIEDLDNLRDGSSKLRFAYCLEKNNAFDNLYNDNLSITVDMKGKDIPSLNYIWSFDEDNKTINYKFIEDGTYTIVYCDNN